MVRLGSMTERRRNGRRHWQRAAAALVVATICGCSWRLQGHVATNFTCGSQPATSSSTSPALARRQSLFAAVAAGLLPLFEEEPSEAIFGFFEPWVAYNLSEVFNISFPPSYVVVRDDPNFKVWDGDKIQPLQKMSASAKATNFASLADALGDNVTEVGLKLSLKRPEGKANLLDAQVDPLGTGKDIYQFEFENERIHELVLFALVIKDGKRYLCNVGLRTPAIIYIDRKSEFEQIMTTFTPWEPQPNRTLVIFESEAAKEILEAEKDKVKSAESVPAS